MARRNNPPVCVVITTFFLFIVSEIAAARPPPPRVLQNDQHFVLVHGGCLGAWSWFRLVELLRSSGRNVTAIDLKASGIDPRPVNDIRSLSDYFGPLMRFMESLPVGKRVILVGHSFGGYAISKAMEVFPEKIAVAVFASAAMPGPNLNASVINQEIGRRLVLLDSYYEYSNGTNNLPTSFICGPQYMATFFYQLSPREDLTLATLLVRPQRVFTNDDTSNEMVLTNGRYGSVKRVFIISSQDLSVPEDLARWMIMRNPTDQVKIVMKSDHMVMISQPKQLFNHLRFIAHKYS